MLNKLKELRIKKGISQRALGEIVGISQQSINKYENHNIEPDIATLVAFANYFNTSVDYLIGNTTVEHKIEPVTKFDLNSREIQLIENYRQLNGEEKNSIEFVIRNYISLKK